MSEAEYPKRVYPVGASKGVTVHSPEEEVAVMGADAPLLNERDKLTEELVKGFRAHLAELSDDDLREKYDDLINPDGGGDDLDKLTVAKLVDLAKIEEIDLGEAKKRDDVLAAIRAGREAKAAA